MHRTNNSSLAFEQSSIELEGPSHKLIINPSSKRLVVFFSGTKKVMVCSTFGTQAVSLMRTSFF